MIEPTFCSGLADIASRYGGFIVDQWGVLHDGARPYPDALDCLARLRETGKRVVLLSNSGKRTAINRARLAEIGIDSSLYDDVVTSGEATWQALAARTDPFYAGLGRRCFLWSRDGDRSALDGLPLEVVDRIEDADFLLLGGVEDDARLEDFGAALDAAAGRGLPMVCANPDIVAVLPDGGFGMAPGAVAHHYEQLGGRVGYVGKPHRPIYEVCLRALGDLPHAEVLTIGDSIAHDVAGGAAMELDTALIMSGIHSRLFDPDRGPSANRAAMEQLALEYGVLPR
ncbi:MAG: TIGR01459 family HAD-type hydrolase, partial [Geminicoccaceae bacterium]